VIIPRPTGKVLLAKRGANEDDMRDDIFGVPKRRDGVKKAMSTLLELVDEAFKSLFQGFILD
jgi:hypothetical protein